MFYNFETDEYITRSELFKSYMQDITDKSQDYNATFEHYIESCLYINNGSLYRLDDRINELETRHKKLTVSDETIDELENITGELKKAYEFRSKNACEDDRMIIRSYPDTTIENIFKGKSGCIITIYRHGQNDYCACWDDSYSVRGTFIQILEELKGEF